MTGPAAADGWERLDPRMLLIGPAKVLKELAIPAIVALIGLRTSNLGQPLFYLPVIVVPIALGVLPWLTTRYRVTGSQFQRRSGLLNRKQLTAPLDRVRSVDLESSLLHRALGLVKVQVGTGVDDTRIELDSLSRDQAERLRRFLLARAAAARAPRAPRPGPATPTPTKSPSAAVPAATAPAGLSTGPAGAPDRGSGHVTAYAAPSVPPIEQPLNRPVHQPVDQPLGQPADQSLGQPADQPFHQPFHQPLDQPVELARIDWSWLRFAPFSLSRLAIVAGAIGVLLQFTDELPFLDAEHLGAAWQWLLGFALPLVLLVSALAASVGWVVVSVIGYVVQWWGLRLVREHGTLRLTAGLLTTRSTTVEEARVRGVRLVEQFPLRLVGGAELATLATGVGSGGVTTVLPPCPLPVTRQVGGTVVDAPEPLVVPLSRHGPAARRRCHVRSQRPTLLAATALLLTAAPAVSSALRPSPWAAATVIALLALAGILAGELTYRNLGHALTPAHLVSGDGALTRRRTVLETDGIIGWVLRQTWFQRRRDLVTLVATTAAGSEKVVVRDLPSARALALADRATPGLLTPFLEP